jgi:hypothetical protein
MIASFDIWYFYFDSLFHRHHAGAMVFLGDKLRA